MINRIGTILNKGMKKSLVMALVLSFGIMPVVTSGQDRIKQMPGYEQYQKISKEIPNSVKMGELFVTWKDGGSAFEYAKDGKSYRYDIAANKTTETGTAPENTSG